MPPRPVYWSDGMFLRPQHFQAAEEHLHERIHRSEDWYQPYSWGLRSFQINLEAIRSYRFQVISCEARMRDGTIVSVPQETEPAPLDLRSAFEKLVTPMVYLAVPRFQDGQPGVVADGSLTTTDARVLAARFRPVYSDRNDRATGENEDPIEFLSLRAHLMAGPEGHEVAGYELLPLARLQRVAAGIESVPALDTSYIPPLLRVGAWSGLREEIEKFVSFLRGVVQNEADYMVGRKLSMDNSVMGDAERVFKLLIANTAIVPFEAALPPSELHPHIFFVELCRLAGQLGLFEKSRCTPSVAAYDHDRLGMVFPPLLDMLRRMLGQQSKRQVRRVYFTLGRDKVFRAAVEPAWLNSTSKMFIGVESDGLSVDECDRMLGRGKCDWKLASAHEVFDVFKNAQTGLGLSPLRRIPPELSTGVAYYEFERREPYWRGVLQSNAFGLMFKLQSREGFRGDDPTRITLLSPLDNREIGFRFAVYYIDES